MKIIPRMILFYSFSLYITSEIFSGLVVYGGIKTILMGGLVFAGLNLIVRPILKAVSFPLTLITLGLFSFVINGGVLYLLTKIIPQIHVYAFTFQRVSYKTYTIPSYHFSIIFAFIFLSAIISFLTTMMMWIAGE